MESEVDIAGEITEIEVVAVGNSIRELSRLRKVYGQGRWRKLKGRAVGLASAISRLNASLHIGDHDGAKNSKASIRGLPEK